VEGKYAEEKEIKDIDEAVKTRCQEAADFAETSEEPGPDALYEDVYA
jgi:pyruvate dehydrogenase E1 component alpha subunit